jgi:hypothetical protein
LPKATTRMIAARTAEPVTVRTRPPVMVAIPTVCDGSPQTAIDVGEWPLKYQLAQSSRLEGGVAGIAGPAARR